MSSAETRGAVSLGRCWNCKHWGAEAAELRECAALKREDHPDLAVHYGDYDYDGLRTGPGFGCVLFEFLSPPALSSPPPEPQEGRRMRSAELRLALERAAIVRYRGSDAHILTMRLIGPAMLVCDLELYVYDDETHTSGNRMLVSAEDVESKVAPKSVGDVVGYLKDRTRVYLKEEP